MKQKNVCGFFINGWVFQKAHKHIIPRAHYYYSDLMCIVALLSKNEMMDVIYTLDFCHNTTVYHNTVTRNFQYYNKHQNTKNLRNEEGWWSESSFWPPSWMFLHIQYWRCGIIFTPALFSFSLVSRGDWGCLSKAFFFGSQDLKVCVYRKIAL